MKILCWFLIAVALVLSGCQTGDQGAKTSKGTEVKTSGPIKEPGTATSNDVTLEVPITKLAEFIVTGEGAGQVISFKPNADGTLKLTGMFEQARTPTTNVEPALQQIKSDEKKPLLYAAIGSVVVALAGLLLKYPIIMAGGSIASAVFFAAWKISDLPPWFWWLGALVIAGSVAVAIGYSRREQDERANKS